MPSAHTSSLDRLIHAWIGRFTLGLSPASLMLAYQDWLVHLMFSPGKQAELVKKTLRNALGLGTYAVRSASGTTTPPCIEPLIQDQHFSDPAWQQWPFNLFCQSFLSIQQWWHNATTDIQGVSQHHEDVVSFAARQILDIFAPSNVMLTNPEILKTTLEQGGMNLVRGMRNFIEDWERSMLGKKPVGTESFEVGKTVVVTPGKVVYRNRLIELLF
jgi:polyhydroxyalkanoate synthase